MKKTLLSLSLVASLFAGDIVLSKDSALNILKKTPIYTQVAQRINQDEIKVKGLDKGDLYVITLYNKKGAQNVFVTKNLKYTMLGLVLNNITKEPVIVDYPAKPFKGNPQIVKDGVLFSFGHGKKDLYIVTDPECPFCQRFEKAAKKTNFGDKYRIHVIFLPLSFHKHSMAMIEYILSAPTQDERVKRFHETLQGSDAWKSFKPTKAQKKMVAKEIEKSKKAAEELGARGTPSFYDEHMKEIKSRRRLFQ